MLAVFDSASGAVHAATEIQQALAEANSDLEEGRRMQFRIGVNLGDIEEAGDGTIYGDGVNVAVRLEYAKAPVHRAAYTVANNQEIAAHAVSHAKLVACEAANLAAKHSIQVHGAMGYTWEVDLHIYMKKAWALANTWGDAGFHKTRVADRIFAEGAALGADATFG